MQHTELHHVIGTDGSDAPSLGLILPVVVLKGMTLASLWYPNTTRLNISSESTGSYVRSRSHVHLSSVLLGTSVFHCPTLTARFVSQSASQQ